MRVDLKDGVALLVAETEQENSPLRLWYDGLFSGDPGMGLAIVEYQNPEEPARNCNGVMGENELLQGAW